MKRFLVITFYVSLFLTSVGCGPAAYNYVKVKESIHAGKTDNLSESELEIEALLKKAASHPLCASYFKKFFTKAYLPVDGFDNLSFTVTIENDKMNVSRGTDPEGNPDLIIPLSKQNCENLLAIFEDGEISDEEEYRIFYVTFIPSYKSVLNRDAMYDPLVAKHMALPNYMQIVLKNENNYVYQNTTKELTMTVVNVDGQWLVFKGLMGDPDVRFAVSHKEAGDFTSMILKASTATNEDRLTLLNNIKAFMDKTTVYIRKQ